MPSHRCLWRWEKRNQLKCIRSWRSPHLCHVDDDDCWCMNCSIFQRRTVSHYSRPRISSQYIRWSLRLSRECATMLSKIQYFLHTGFGSLGRIIVSRFNIVYMRFQCEDSTLLARYNVKSKQRRYQNASATAQKREMCVFLIIIYDIEDICSLDTINK